MTDLADGESTEMQGSGAKPYVLKNIGGVYSCSCPAWRNQSTPIERRTCKHLRKLRGEAAEKERLGSELVDDKSNKFWEVDVSGTEVTVRYGRIGTDGTSKAKDLGTKDKAQAHADKLIGQKTLKGYEEK